MWLLSSHFSNNDDGFARVLCVRACNWSKPFNFLNRTEILFIYILVRKMNLISQCSVRGFFACAEIDPKKEDEKIAATAAAFRQPYRDCVHGDRKPNIRMRAKKSRKLTLYKSKGAI